MARFDENNFDEAFGSERMQRTSMRTPRRDATRDRESTREMIRRARREKGEVRTVFTDWDCRATHKA